MTERIECLLLSMNWSETVTICCHLEEKGLRAFSYRQPSSEILAGDKKAA